MTKQTDVNDLLREVIAAHDVQYGKPEVHGAVLAKVRAYLDSLGQGPLSHHIPPHLAAERIHGHDDRLDSLEARMLQREAADTSGPWDKMGELDARVERIEKVLRGLLEEWLILAPKSYIEKALHDLAPPSTQEKNDG